MEKGIDGPGQLLYGADGKSLATSRAGRDKFVYLSLVELFPVDIDQRLSHAL
jgi:hypothetical protein